MRGVYCHFDASIYESEVEWDGETNGKEVVLVELGERSG